MTQKLVMTFFLVFNSSWVGVFVKLKLPLKISESATRFPPKLILTDVLQVNQISVILEHEFTSLSDFSSVKKEHNSLLTRISGTANVIFLKLAMQSPN